MMNWRDAVCEEAMSWLSTPYVPRARVKGVGTDCGGILYECYNPHFGPFPAFPQDYAVDWACHTEEEKYLNFIMPFVHQVPMGGKGDFVLFHLAKCYAHAAINLGDGRFIHAWGRKGAGQVTIHPYRVLKAMCKDPKFPPKHFTPNGG